MYKETEMRDITRLLLKDYKLNIIKNPSLNEDDNDICQYINHKNLLKVMVNARVEEITQIIDLDKNKLKKFETLKAEFNLKCTD